MPRELREPGRGETQQTRGGSQVSEQRARERGILCNSLDSAFVHIRAIFVVYFVDLHVHVRVEVYNTGSVCVCTLVRQD